MSTLLSAGPADYVAIGADGFFEVPDDYKAAFMRKRTIEEIASAAR